MYLVNKKFKDVCIELVSETKTQYYIQWWNVSIGFNEPFPMGAGTTLAREYINKNKIDLVNWVGFNTIEKAKAYTLRRLNDPKPRTA